MNNLTPSQRLLPPNRTPLEAVLAGVTDLELSTDGLRHLWSAVHCLGAALPWLSWTMSVEAWHEAKSDDARRALILHRSSPTRSKFSACFSASSLLGETPYATSTRAYCPWCASRRARR